MGLLPLATPPAAQPTTLAALSLGSPPLMQSQNFPGTALARNISASGVVIMDVQSGQELFARHADRRRPVGSLTKMMTAVIIAESHTMDEVVTIPKDGGMVEGEKLPLPPNAHFTVGDLLSAMLISSANDAAEVLARFHSGSRGDFVAVMNDRARQLGLRDTAFANPSGLDEAGQWSTARDMARLAKYAVRNADIRKRMSTSQASIYSKEGQKFVLIHTHSLLKKGSAVIAGKTGTTAAARQCLFSLVKEKDREYIVVILGSRERYIDMRFVLRVLRTLFA